MPTGVTALPAVLHTQGEGSLQRLVFRTLPTMSGTLTYHASRGEAGCASRGFCSSFDPARWEKPAAGLIAAVFCVFGGEFDPCIFDRAPLQY